MGAHESEERRLRALRERFEQVLARRRRLTFAAFMRLALYTPILGYYASGVARTGARGDFVTSPEVHPVFAALLARQVAECWELLERPSPFTVVELGGGRGRFAADFWAAVEAEHASLAAALRYILVDPAPGPRLPRVERRRRLPIAVEAGCVLANEVFDALPVHLLQRDSRALREVYVVLHDGRLSEQLGPLSRPALRRALEMAGVELALGQRVEVCLAAPTLVARLGRMLRRGYIIALDYGALDWAGLVALRPRGTLRTFAGHAPAGVPLDAPGAVDLTHHVDFGALVRAAEGAGLAVVGLTSQRSFLTRLGWRTYLTALPRVVRGAAYEANAHALRYLVQRGGLGDFLVLGLAAGGAPATLSGFAQQSPLACDLLAHAERGALVVPLLTADHAPLWSARQPAMPDFDALWAEVVDARQEEREA